MHDRPVELVQVTEFLQRVRDRELDSSGWATAPEYGPSTERSRRRRSPGATLLRPTL